MSLVRVLIADPDQLLVASYREFLAGEGFEVATAADGLDCMAKLRSFAPDVLVLEPAQLWGGGDGVLARLREEADLSPAKVLVLSARLDLDRLDCQAAPGVGAYQAKPVSPDLLAETIRRMLGPTSPRGHGDRPADGAGRPTRVDGPRERANPGP